MNEYIIITTTCIDKEEADKVVKTLLEKRLVSCCQLSNILSSYHWNGKIEESDEVLITMKSKKSLFKQIKQEILNIHSYDIPQIVAYDITCGYEAYLDWIDRETK